MYKTSTADTTMAAPSTTNKTTDTARHTPFIALRQPFAPFLCSLRCYARACIRILLDPANVLSGIPTPCRYGLAYPNILRARGQRLLQAEWVPQWLPPVPSPRTHR